MENRGNRVMTAQYNIAIKEPDEYIKFYMDETNVRRWYVLLHGFSGTEDEFVDGQYLARLEFPERFPIEPPWFYFMTPNGVYQVEDKVCISIGGYHKSDYPAALGARGFAKQLVNGFIGWKFLEGGVNLLDTTIKEKKRLAKDSVLYNSLNNAMYIAKINAAYNEYSKSFPVVVKNIEPVPTVVTQCDNVDVTDLATGSSATGSSATGSSVTDSSATQ